MRRNLALNAFGVILCRNLEGATKVVQDHRLAGTNSIFLAIKGKRLDGRSFIHEALEVGSYVVCEPGISEDGRDFCSNIESERLILVPDMEQFMKDVIREICRSFKAAGAKIIGITGSSGKTTTKMWMLDVLRSKFPKVYSIEDEYINYNCELIGPLMSLFMLPDDTPVVIIEVGVGKPGDMSLIAPLLGLDLAIVMNVAYAHIGGFEGDREALIREKLSLCEYATRAVVHENLASYASIRDVRYFGPTRIRETGGWESLEAVIMLDRPTLNDQRSEDIHQTGINVRLDRLFQPHSLENVAAIVNALEMLFPGIDFSDGFRSIEPLKGRGRMLDAVVTGKRLRIFDSSYNANAGPNGSMYQDLRALERLARNGYRVGAILGEMLELGERSVEMHIEIRDYAICITQKLCFVGDWPLDLTLGRRRFVHHREFLTRDNVDEFIVEAFDLFEDGDLVLVKGSNGVGLYDVLMETISPTVH